MHGWTWNTCRASKRCLGRGFRRLAREQQGPVMLQEALRARTLVSPGYAQYANLGRSCAQVVPQCHGARIKAEVSDVSFLGLVFDTRFALFTVYLPDMGKSEHAYEGAIEQLSVGI